MHRFNMGSALALLVAASASVLDAQVRWDDVSKMYWVTVHDDSGTAREMRVQPANRVVPRLELEQVDSGGVITYRYRIGADSASPQSLGILRLPCPANGSISQLQGGFRRRVRDWGEVRYCTFDVGRFAGQPLMLVRFSSGLLGGTGRGIAVGSREVPVWPTSDPTDETVALSALVDSLAGLSPNGLVTRFAAPVPQYERAVVAQADTGFKIIAYELRKICAETDWIPSASTCDSLAALLAPTTAAIRRSPATRQASLTPAERTAMLQALNRFIRALMAGRGSTIHQNAYTILHALARTVRAPLIPPPSP